jgi:hypothetical protein
MCIAIAKPEFAKLSEETLRTCFTNNPDGAGFAYHDGSSVVVFKGFFKFEDFYEAYKKHDINSKRALVHFRITTRGDTSADNCHPFKLNEGALVHNGTIYSIGAQSTGMSDTAMLAQMLYDVPKKLFLNLRMMIDSFVAGSRVAILTNDNEFLLFNEKQWHVENGVMYSNTTFKPRVVYVPPKYTPSVTPPSPYQHSRTVLGTAPSAATYGPNKATYNSREEHFAKLRAKYGKKAKKQQKAQEQRMREELSLESNVYSLGLDLFEMFGADSDKHDPKPFIWYQNGLFTRDRPTLPYKSNLRLEMKVVRYFREAYGRAPEFAVDWEALTLITASIIDEEETCPETPSKTTSPISAQLVVSSSPCSAPTSPATSLSPSTSTVPLFD